jgi:hypothetical protein
MKSLTGKLQEKHHEKDVDRTAAAAALATAFVIPVAFAQETGKQAPAGMERGQRAKLARARWASEQANPGPRLKQIAPKWAPNRLRARTLANRGRREGNPSRGAREPDTTAWRRLAGRGASGSVPRTASRANRTGGGPEPRGSGAKS